VLVRSWVSACLVIWASLLLMLTPSLQAKEYVLSFEERNRYEGLVKRYPRLKGAYFLHVLVDGKEVYRIDLSSGPFWNVQVKFSVENPENVTISFRLPKKAGDPILEIGNIRVRELNGGEVALKGKWVGKDVKPWFWDFAPLPAFRNGFALRPAYGAKDFCEWSFRGKLQPIANLQIRRLFEYAGCYQELGFYDDWKKISFKPRNPQPGDRVTITVRVRNAGALDAKRVKVQLKVDGKVIGSKTADIPSMKEVPFTFTWRATEGFHCFVAYADPDGEIPETRKDDNWLLRTLVVGEVRKAHPYLLFRRDYISKLRRWLGNPPKWYARYYEDIKQDAGWIEPDECSGVAGLEEPRALVAAANGLLSLVEPDFKPKKKVEDQWVTVKDSTLTRAKKFLMTMWQFHRGWFSDAPCSIAFYAQTYDFIADRLSPEEDKEVRRRLARAVEERVKELWSNSDPRSRKGPPPPREKSFYPVRRRAYTQGSYIEACAIVVGALALAGHPKADEWLHFGLNAIDEEILREMTTPFGYYREGHGYMAMAESRSGAVCWLALENIGASPFELYPLAEKMHELFLRDRMPNGWCPPINDNRATSTIPQVLYVSLYTAPSTRAAAMWDWKTQTHIPRGTLPDSHYGCLFLLFDTPEKDKLPSSPPPWTPTQFLGDYLVFRSDWSPDAAYLCLNTKHFPTTSASHDQGDHNSFLMYAKRAFLAIDAGYGNTAGRLIHLVRGWCRGSRYAHNMILVDGQRPRSYHKSPYVYPNAPFPRNTFTTKFFDFGESVLEQWEFRNERGETCVLNHRRSVLFPHTSPSPAQHYFIVADRLESLTDNVHTYEFVLNGNCRYPYLNPRRLGDFVQSPASVDAVRKANNLTVERKPEGVEARWVIQNSDGQDVAFRAFFPISPQSVEVTTGDGWLGYLRPIARNKYLVLRKEGVRHASFLAILYPDLMNDPNDDVSFGRTERGARLTFKDGKTHVVELKDLKPEPATKGLYPDILFYELSPEGELNVIFFARGKEISLKDFELKASAPVNVLALDFRKAGKASGYISVSKPVTLKIRSSANYNQATLDGRELRSSFANGWLTLEGVTGAGRLLLLSN